MPPERVDLEALAPSPAAGFATVTTFAFDERPHTAMPQKMPSRSRRQHQGRSTAPPFAACEQLATSPGGIGVGVEPAFDARDEVAGMLDGKGKDQTKPDAQRNQNGGVATQCRTQAHRDAA